MEWETMVNSRTKCQIWSRVVGYLRPTDKWNEGKQEEFNDRRVFDERPSD